MKLTIQRIQKAINISIEKWAGNCHLISCLIIEKKLIFGEAVYGHWVGPITETSIFAKYRHLPFVRHGWIILKNGEILDPTRWVFEDVKPYIYKGKNDFYDRGGNIWRENNLRPPPSFKDKNFPINKYFSTNKLPKLSVEFLAEILCDSSFVKRKTASLSQLFWIANLPPSMLGEYIQTIYKWLVQIGQGVLIPMDNREAILKK